MEPSVGLGHQRAQRLVLRVAAVISLLAGTVVVSASASTAVSSAYAVTEVPVQHIANSVAADPVTDIVYAALSSGPAIAVIDGADNTVTGQISLGLYATLVAVDQGSDTVYAISNTTGTGPNVDVINGATNSVTATISLPTQIWVSAAVNPVTHMIYVTDEEGSVAVIDGSTETVAATIPLADPVLAPSPRPLGVAVDAAANMIYVTDEREAQVDVIDGATNAVTGRITLPAGSDPVGVAVDPAAGVVYTADEATGAISVIDTATDSASTLVGGIAQPYGLALDAESGSLYATAFGGSPDNLGTAYVIDTASGAIAAQIPRGGRSIALVPGSSVYIDQSSAAGGLDNDVTVITPSTANTMSPAIVGNTSFVFVTGQAGQDQLTASATPAATFSATGLPAWLTLSPSGLLSGTPASDTGGAHYLVHVTASNGILPSASSSVTVAVDVPPAITSVDQTTFPVGLEDSFTVTAAGVPAPTFAETGVLPAGVVFSSAGALSGTPAPTSVGSYPIQITATNSVGTATQAFTLIVAESRYTPVAPVRVLDTRNGTGGFYFPLGPGQGISLQMTGMDGVPSSGVTAVVLNVTATSPSASSFITVFPSGGAQPVTSNLNFAAGETIPNLVVVPVGPWGAVAFYNSFGTVNLIADLAGYYTTGTGSALVAAGPVRVLDTRNGTGHSGPVGPGQAISLKVSGVAGVPVGATAVVLNVTATSPSTSSFVTVYPDGSTRPVTSNLNFTRGETIPNLVVVPVGADGKVDLYNSVGTVHLIADLAGYYISGSGSSFVPAGPVRVLDTRDGTGGQSGPVGPGQTIILQVAGVAGVPSSGVTAVVLNVTATEPSASSFVTIYPDGSTRPVASNLNFTPGETIPNLVVVPVGADGEIDLYNSFGTVNLIADLAGYYVS